MVLGEEIYLSPDSLPDIIDVLRALIRKYEDTSRSYDKVNTNSHDIAMLNRAIKFLRKDMEIIVGRMQEFLQGKKKEFQARKHD